MWTRIAVKLDLVLYEHAVVGQYFSHIGRDQLANDISAIWMLVSKFTATPQVTCS